MELLKSLFIPEEDYLSNAFSSLKDSFVGKLGFDSYLDFFESLKSQRAGNLSSFGNFVKVDVWNDYLPTIQSFIKGFFYCLIGIFNIKQVMWLVRGSAPIGGGDSK